MPDTEIKELIRKIMVENHKASNNELALVFANGYGIIFRKLEDVHKKVEEVDKKADAAATSAQVAATQATKTNSRVDKLEGRSHWPDWVTTMAQWLQPALNTLILMAIFYMLGTMINNHKVAVANYQKIDQIKEAVTPEDRH